MVRATPDCSTFYNAQRPGPDAPFPAQSEFPGHAMRLAILAKRMRASQFTVRPLEGGARLVTAPMLDRDSASLVLMFGVGSRYEEDRLGGASHFIEHLFFKGTRRRPTAKEIAEAIEGVGGVLNASTDKELTSYWTRVPADHLELGIDVLFDIVADSS